MKIRMRMKDENEEWEEPEKCGSVQSLKWINNFSWCWKFAKKIVAIMATETLLEMLGETDSQYKGVTYIQNYSLQFRKVT